MTDELTDNLTEFSADLKADGQRICVCFCIFKSFVFRAQAYLFYLKGRLRLMQKCNHGCATVPESHRTSLRLLQILHTIYSIYYHSSRAILLSHFFHILYRYAHKCVFYALLCIYRFFFYTHINFHYPKKPLFNQKSRIKNTAFVPFANLINIFVSPAVLRFHWRDLRPILSNVAPVRDIRFSSFDPILQSYFPTDSVPIQFLAQYLC